MTIARTVPTEVESSLHLDFPKSELNSFVGLSVSLT